MRVHVRDVLWHRVNQAVLVRLVIVRDPGRGRTRDFFLTTHRTATGAKGRLALRRPLVHRVCFRDVKQYLGRKDPRT